MNKDNLLSQTLIDELENIIQKNISKEIVPGKDLIPASAPTLSSQDIFEGISSLLNGWLTEGEYCKRFEKKLKNYFGSHAALLTNSGSSANLLSISALCSPALRERALKKGDEILTIAAGFPTTINPIVQNGLIPVFMDIDPTTYNIQIEDIESAISDKTKAIIIAHSLGNPFNLEVICEAAKKHNLWMIEDNCDAFGAEYKSKKTGSFGDLSTLSFFPAHQITTGEGGAIIINNPKLKKIVTSFRNWGRDCWCIAGDDNTCGKRFDHHMGDLPHGYDHKYVFSHLGYNLKMTESQAAIGTSQVERIDQFVEARRENHAYLFDRFKTLEDYFILPKATEHSNPSWFGFMLTCREGVNRQELLQELAKRKVGTRLFFAGNITKQPAYQNVEYRIHGSLSNTDMVMNNSFWIGVWPGLSKVHLDYVFESVRDFVLVKQD